MSDTFATRRELTVGTRKVHYYSLKALEEKFPRVARLPYSLKILLENLLRTEDGLSVRPEDISALCNRDPKTRTEDEIAFTPARVLLQDFTGVPALVDLAAMREAMRRLGGDPKRINPLSPVELVIDHSVQVDAFGSKDAITLNTSLEYQRNLERYRFLKWGQQAFDNFRVVPPETGIVHQVNLERLARVVMEKDGVVYPDTVVGTDSHTTMINGLGVLGWGVGGIEAEAAMLGQAISMLVPEVLGVRLTGELPEGTTATDLVLRVTELLRKHGVVGKFVEFFGPGLASLGLADRATISNMAPEYGATAGLFPVDAESLRFLRLTGRSEDHIGLVEAYFRAQGMFYEAGAQDAEYTEVLSVELSATEAALAGPARPQDRVNLREVPENFRAALQALRQRKPAAAKSEGPITASYGGVTIPLLDGAVVLAAITSCTNTSNPSVMLAAGLVAKKAVERGLVTKPWVKTSLAPGSKVVTEYLRAAGLLQDLEKLGFHVVGYGCTTCIGNSGPLPEETSKAIEAGDLLAVAVISGNRNFEGRVHAEVRANYLASPPLVVAYALSGRIDIDWKHEPVGHAKDGSPIYLADLWPTSSEIANAVSQALDASMFKQVYANVFAGNEHWERVNPPLGDLYAWDSASTYVKHPPYFETMSLTPSPTPDLHGAHCLAKLGDSITTDHISPAGNIKQRGPAAHYLTERGVLPIDFNQYGARRGNDEVMVRGTFANIRLRNQLAPGTEGGVTRHLPSGEAMSIFDASLRYRAEGVPVFILAGKEYGSGSSRDWAAKGPMLLGVRMVLAESYERIHRSNLVGMGILPLQFLEGQNAVSLGLEGTEKLSFVGLSTLLQAKDRGPKHLRIHAEREDGSTLTFDTRVRIDTPKEALYYEHGGILPFVLRQLLAR